MIRKQLYITETQEEELKRRSEETGLSEAELVRRALDAALSSGAARRWRPGKADALARLKETWRDSRGQLDEPFERDAFYEDRMAQLHDRQDG